MPKWWVVTPGWCWCALGFVLSTGLGTLLVSTTRRRSLASRILAEGDDALKFLSGLSRLLLLRATSWDASRSSAALGLAPQGNSAGSAARSSELSPAQLPMSAVAPT